MMFYGLNQRSGVSSPVSAHQADLSMCTALSATGVNYNVVDIHVFYGALPVLHRNIDCTNGCLIYAKDTNSSDDIMSKYPGAHSICLPETHPHPQAKEIFGGMKRGVFIRLEDGTIYVTPFCRVVIYCGSSLSGPGIALEREKPTRVFDYISKSMSRYPLFTISGKTINPDVFLSLGQSWGQGRHLNENLMVIKITSTRTWIEHESKSTHLPTKDSTHSGKCFDSTLYY